MSLFDFSKIAPFVGCKEIHPNTPLPTNLVGLPSAPLVRGEHYRSGEKILTPPTKSTLENSRSNG